MNKVFYYEWLHFSRNVSRPIAVGLFLLAAIFGLYNGLSSYNDRLGQLQSIEERTSEAQQLVYGWFDEGKPGPDDRPWVDIKTPFWSMWHANHYLVQRPQPTMIFNMGQSEHFGYYKRVSMWTTAFDADLTAEIANPELIQLGALDFTFAWLYLMPLLLIVLTYHTRGLEHDLGFIPLLKVQQPSLNVWVLWRLFITGLGLLVLLSLLVWLPPLFFLRSFIMSEVLTLWMVYSAYLLFWLVLVYMVIRWGNGQADQALKMLGIWLLLVVAIPGMINQYVLLKKPADLMISMIEASRDGRKAIYNRSQVEIIKEAVNMIPELKESDATKYDSLLTQPMINGAYRVVLNVYMNLVSIDILSAQEARNQLIISTYWFNPVTAFHNWLNRLTFTGHEGNMDFRRDIQQAGETINRTLLMDEWNNRVMNRSSFDTYVQLFTNQEL